MLSAQTTSSMRSYRKCPRLYRYLYLDLVRPARTPVPFLIGSAFHYATELFWHGAKQNEIVDGLETYLSTENYWSTDKGRFQASKVMAMAWSYYNRWASSRSKYEVVAVEKGIEFKLIDASEDSSVPADIFAVGKFDALVKEKGSDKHWLVEHKTADFDVSDAGHPYWERLALDLQVTLYSHPLRAVYGDLGIIFDVSRKPRHRPKTSKGAVVETPSEYYKRVRAEMSSSLNKYFERRQVHRSRAQNLEILEEARDTAREMTNAKSFPRSDSACVRGGMSCEFLGVCSGSDRLDSENFTKAEDPHPELSG